MPDKSNDKPTSDYSIKEIVQFLLKYRIGENEKFSKRAINGLVKRLKSRTDELDSLITVIASKGGSRKGCVTLAKTLDGRLQVGTQKCFPHVIFSRIWRWPEVQKNDLESISNCEYGFDLRREWTCINPYHYERVNIPVRDLKLDSPMDFNVREEYNRFCKTQNAIGEMIQHRQVLTSVVPNNMEQSLHDLQQSPELYNSKTAMPVSDNQLNTYKYNFSCANTPHSMSTNFDSGQSFSNNENIAQTNLPFSVTNNVLSSNMQENSSPRSLEANRAEAYSDFSDLPSEYGNFLIPTKTNIKPTNNFNKSDTIVNSLKNSNFNEEHSMRMDNDNTIMQVIDNHPPLATSTPNDIEHNSEKLSETCTSNIETPILDFSDFQSDFEDLIPPLENNIMSTDFSNEERETVSGNGNALLQDTQRHASVSNNFANNNKPCESKSTSSFSDFRSDLVSLVLTSDTKLHCNDGLTQDSFTADSKMFEQILENDLTLVPENSTESKQLIKQLSPLASTTLNSITQQNYQSSQLQKHCNSGTEIPTTAYANFSNIDRLVTPLRSEITSNNCYEKYSIRNTHNVNPVEETYKQTLEHHRKMLHITQTHKTEETVISIKNKQTLQVSEEQQEINNSEVITRTPELSVSTYSEYQLHQNSSSATQSGFRNFNGPGYDDLKTTNHYNKISTHLQYQHQENIDSNKMQEGICKFNDSRESSLKTKNCYKENENLHLKGGSRSDRDDNHLLKHSCTTGTGMSTTDYTGSSNIDGLMTPFQNNLMSSNYYRNYTNINDQIERPLERAYKQRLENPKKDLQISQDHTTAETDTSSNNQQNLQLSQKSKEFVNSEVITSIPVENKDNKIHTNSIAQSSIGCYSKKNINTSQIITSNKCSDSSMLVTSLLSSCPQYLLHQNTCQSDLRNGLHGFNGSRESSLKNTICYKESENLDQSENSYVNKCLLNSPRSQFWCSIAYLELDIQVGDYFYVENKYLSVIVDGYVDPSGRNRFCVGALTNLHRKPQSERTRLHIGKGVKLELRGEGDIWLHCLSEHSVYLQSPYLDLKAGRPLGSVVHKVFPNVCIKVFDLRKCHSCMKNQVVIAYTTATAQELRGRDNPFLSSAIKNFDTRTLLKMDEIRRQCILRLSFVKGWGPDYPRQNIKNTPCWIEIHLHRALQVLDEVISLPLNTLRGLD